MATAEFFLAESSGVSGEPCDFPAGLVADPWESPSSSPASIWKPTEILFHASTQLGPEAAS